MTVKELLAKIQELGIPENSEVCDRFEGDLFDVVDVSYEDGITILEVVNQ